ncbi:flagellin [Massilia sp. TWR1-2-2]|uniref:flagellin N-terminal helical domain-containing protein n=1 Tax=Massilia sp. TWR1-2-2 TaxID=2804584 RepID=UPI003CF47114
MAAFINTNIASLNSQRNLNSSQTALTTSLQRLSSGLRINSAKDDAAGLAISERMTSQINGSDQAARNANDGISLAQTAEGDLAQIGTNLQRMRELAVQASNGTNSASDRAALNGEVQSLAAEIDRVAQNSSFNGVKLLDGSFSSQDFQIGANNTSNDRITIESISSARTSQLGGVGTSFDAKISSGATTGALSAGDMTLNGFQVGASAMGAAPGQSASSASSIAAAINKISADSGVTASADVNKVSGSSATTFGATTGAIAADTFSINGVNVGAVSGGATAAGQGANVAAAINKIATQTGVTASANATTGALTLTASDGRDISIGLNGTAASTAAVATDKTAFLAQTGLATAAVGTKGGTETTEVAFGAYTALSSTTATDKFSISVDGQSLLASTAVGTGITAATVQAGVDSFATANSATHSVSGTVAGGDLKITKLDGTASAVKIESSNAAGSAVAVGTPSGGFASQANIAYGGAAVSTTAGTGTGVAVGVAKANHGTVTLSSSSASGIVYGGANLAKAGLAAAGGVVAATTTSSVSSLSSMDVLTSANAAKAISAIDGALATVGTSRASLGAYQNRFASVVSSLQTSSENLSASRSRIQDTDFAKETASLTRGQILQQAGTAMLAQANSLPNGVLALLRG